MPRRAWVGLGKLRHIDTGYLWIQEKAAQKELEFGKVAGDWNAADLLKKDLGKSDIEKHMVALSCEFAAGRAESASKLVECDGLLSAVRFWLWPSAKEVHRRAVLERGEDPA